MIDPLHDTWTRLAHPGYREALRDADLWLCEHVGHDVKWVAQPTHGGHRPRKPVCGRCGEQEWRGGPAAEECVSRIRERVRELGIDVTD